jgi:hypothetical protein
MPTLVWDQVGERFFEAGVDRAVLYMPDGSVHPWNGLISVTEKTDGIESAAMFFDGVKYADVLALGNFAASIRAYTYPDEFLEFEGVSEVGNGLFVTNQQPARFGLSYRTKIGSDTETGDEHYKIHVLYNLTATPSDKNYQTLTAEASAIEFEWSVTSIPEKLPGFRPTAHIIIDTRHMSPVLLADLESTLYGDEFRSPKLPPISTLTSFIGEWVIIRITDNYDGTWTATGPDDLVFMLDATTFQINQAAAVYLDLNTYQIGNLTY